MLNKYQIIAGTMLATLILTPACQKKVDTPPVTQTIEEEKWSVEEVNGLLAYVPQDTPIVFASTRSMDMNHSIFQSTLNMVTHSLHDTLQNTLTALENKNQKNEALKGQLQSLNAIYQMLKPLLENNAQGLEDWGLDSQFRIDTIGYIQGITPIAKISLKNSQNFDQKSTELVKKIHQYLAYYIQMPDIIERKVGNDTYRILSLKPLLENTKDICILCDETNKSYLPPNLVIHVGAKNATFALIHDNVDDATLQKIIAPADHPLKKDALGTIESDMLMTGYIHTLSAYQYLKNEAYKPALYHFLDTEITQECDTQMTAWIQKFPKVKTLARLSEQKGLSFHSTLHVADPQILSQIQALHSNAANIQMPNSLASVALNIDLDAALNFATQIHTMLVEKNDTCKPIQQFTKNVKNLSSAFNDPQIRLFTTGLTGINITLDKLDLDANPMVIEAAFALSGSKIGTTIPRATNLAAALAPQLHTLASLTKDTPKEIDLLEIIKYPIKLNTIYTDQTFIVATSNYDVKLLADKPHQKSNQFLTITFDDKLKGSSSKLRTITLPDVTFVHEMGSNPEGLTYSMHMQWIK